MSNWGSTAKALAQWLETQGVLNFEAAPGGDTFVERELPLAPDNAVSIRSTGGFEAGASAMDDDTPTFQFISRATTPQAALDKLKAVYDKLHGAGKFALANNVWLIYAIGVQSGPAPLGQDAQGRWMFSSNYRLMVERKES